MYGHELIDHLFPLHSPRSPVVSDVMDAVRGRFIDLAHYVVDVTPEGPDQTVAIRKLHDAQQAVIGTIANNQGMV